MTYFNRTDAAEQRGAPAVLPDEHGAQHFLDALTAASHGPGGMTFFGARGAVVERLEWEALAGAVEHAAGQLAALGLPQGARVFLLAESCPRFIALFAGAMRAGLVPCTLPLPFAFGSRQSYIERLRRLIDDAPAVIAPGMFADWLIEGFADSGMAFAGGADALPAPVPLAPLAHSPGDTAYIQFSSGTTSAPKGIAISHRAMMANVRAIAAALKIGPEDRGVSWLPWYHDMGLVGTVLLPIICRIDMDFLSTRDFTVRPTLWLDLISKNRATLSYSPSFGYELAARRAKATADLDLSSWRVAGIGGDMVRAQALEDFSVAFADCGFDRRAFLPSYGMAETTLGLAFTPASRGARFEQVDGAHLNLGDKVRRPRRGVGTPLALCGTPLPGHDVEIRDETGAVLEDGRVGRIHARGPGLMSGYVGAPEATSETVSPDGWFLTGDLGFMRGGELVIAGREKEVLMLHGRAVWPQDVEWTVTRAVKGPRTGDAALFRIPGPSGNLDDGPMIVALETRETAPEQRKALAEAVHTAVRAEHGIEVEAVLWPPRSLPRTSSGKLQRAQARAMHLEAVTSDRIKAAS
ncbi:MAG: fatty acyl-AMP ligase [Pseudomonadota bacterium]